MSRSESTFCTNCSCSCTPWGSTLAPGGIMLWRRGGVLPYHHLHRSCYRYVQSYNGLMWSKIVAWASTNITARNSTFYFFCCNQSCIHNILSTMNTMSPYGAITLSPLTHLSSCRITSLWFCRLTAIVSYRHRWFSYSMFTYTYVCLHILISDTHIILYVYLYLRFTNIISICHFIQIYLK